MCAGQTGGKAWLGLHDTNGANQQVVTRGQEKSCWLSIRSESEVSSDNMNFSDATKLVLKAYVVHDRCLWSWMSTSVIIGRVSKDSAL